MSSHVLSEVERLCDRIAVIRAGALVLVSTVDDARRSSGRTVRIEFSSAVKTIALPAFMSYIESTPERWTLRVQGEVGPLLPLIAALPVRDIEIDEPSLEDVVGRFYSGETT
jgi:ABC-2 type transport system ATP-binding protein